MSQIKKQQQHFKAQGKCKYTHLPIQNETHVALSTFPYNLRTAGLNCSKLNRMTDPWHSANTVGTDSSVSTWPYLYGWKKHSTTGGSVTLCVWETGKSKDSSIWMRKVCSQSEINLNVAPKPCIHRMHNCTQCICFDRHVVTHVTQAACSCIMHLKLTSQWVKRSLYRCASFSYNSLNLRIDNTSY